MDKDDDDIIIYSSSSKWIKDIYSNYKTLALKHNINNTLIKTIIWALKLHIKQRWLNLVDINSSLWVALDHKNNLAWKNWYKGIISHKLTTLFPSSNSLPNSKLHAVQHQMRIAINNANEYLKSLNLYINKDQTTFQKIRISYFLTVFL